MRSPGAGALEQLAGQPGEAKWLRAAVVKSATQEVEQLLTPAEVAERLRVSVSQVHRLCRSGRLANHQDGANTIRRIPASSVAAYLDKIKQDAR